MSHVAAKYWPLRKGRDVESVDIADVLAISYDDTIKRQADPSGHRANLHSTAIVI